MFLKGDQGNHFLLLVDGHAVNEQLAGSARFDRGLGVPIELVDHIEVILGPGSVLYGSNAMLGVINVVTKRAKYWSGVHVGGETEIGKSFRASAGAGTTFKLFTLPSELTLALEYYKQKGPTFTFDQQLFGTPDTFSGMPYRTMRNGPPTGIWGGPAYNSYYSEVPAGHLRFVMGPFEFSAHASTFTRAAPYSSYILRRSRQPHDRSLALVRPETSRGALGGGAARQPPLHRFVRQPLFRHGFTGEPLPLPGHARLFQARNG